MIAGSFAVRRHFPLSPPQSQREDAKRVDSVRREVQAHTLHPPRGKAGPGLSENTTHRNWKSVPGEMARAGLAKIRE